MQYADCGYWLSFMERLSFVDSNIILVFPHGFVSGTDDFAVVGKLFQSVSAPAHDTGDGKDGGIQLHGKPQHVIDKAGVEVHVDADAFVHLTLL